MKTERFFIGSQSAKKMVADKIMALDIDGAVIVTIGDGHSKTAKQRGLQFMWCGDVAKSGIGGKHEDTKNGVHVVSKYRFGMPLLAEFYPDHYEIIKALEKKYIDHPDVMYYIADKFISTEDFEVPIMARYLTEFERYYRSRGVNLTIPDDGLLAYTESLDKTA